VNVADPGGVPKSTAGWRQGLRDFRHPGLWRGIGWFGIALLLFLSLVRPPAVDMPVENADKLGHFLAYFVLTGWYGQLFAARRDLLKRALGFALLGACIEVLQSFTGYRTSDWRDEIANTSGIAAAVLATRWVLLGELLMRFERRFLVQRRQP
jgi:VanZ family protein